MATAALIAGRYELRTLLPERSVEGLKEVWSGYDRQLDRDVLVELAITPDAALQERFLARAQLLAAENPPHLVTVYDTGRDGERPYAVLEPLAGMTLAQRFQAGPPFTPAQVVDLGIALCLALGAALQRDLGVEPLDPADVLLRDGEHVKLGNLLLRPPTATAGAPETAAAPDAGITAAPRAMPGPGAAVMPASEQALAARVASLLVAAVQPPGTPLPPAIVRPADLPHGLPATLRTIVLAAVAPRGATIRTLADLRQALADYRGAAISTTRAFAPVTRIATGDMAAAAIAGVADAVPTVTRGLPAAGARALSGATTRRVAVGPLPARSYRRPSRLPSLIGLLAVLLLLGGVGAFAIWLGTVDSVPAGSVPRPTAAPAGLAAVAPTPTPTPMPTPIPAPTATPTPATQGVLGGVPESPTVGGARATETALAGETATAGVYATQTATVLPPTPTTAPTALPTATLPPSPDPSPDPSPSPPPSPDPSPTPADTPTPQPSATPTPTPIPTFAVPDVVGHGYADAQRILTQAGFTVLRRPDQPSTVVAAGAVLAQDPAAATVAPLGSAVRLTVSSGPPGVAVPNVTGQIARDAQSTLSARGFAVNLTQAPSSAAAGVVIAQSPQAGTMAPAGSPVTLTVSAGDTLAVPRVIGLPEDQAQAAIRAAGLTTTFPNRSGHSTVVLIGQVESQDPQPGTFVPKGTVVYINVRSS